MDCGTRKSLGDQSSMYNERDLICCKGNIRFHIKEDFGKLEVLELRVPGEVRKILFSNTVSVSSPF